MDTQTEYREPLDALKRSSRRLTLTYAVAAFVLGLPLGAALADTTRPMVTTIPASCPAVPP